MAAKTHIHCITHVESDPQLHTNYYGIIIVFALLLQCTIQVSTSKLTPKHLIGIASPCPTGVQHDVSKFLTLSFKIYIYIYKL